MTPGIIKRQDSRGIGGWGLCVQAEDWPESWKRWSVIMIVEEAQVETNRCERWIDLGSCFLFPFSKSKGVKLFFV